MQTKAKLRTKIHEERLQFTERHQKECSREIVRLLKNVRLLSSSKIVHVYLPIPVKNEVDSWGLIEWLLANGHEVWTSYLPLDKTNDGFCKVTADTTYGIGRYGIPMPNEPVRTDCAPDVVVLPCLAVDEAGNRLGYGSGWYDKFLSTHPEALRIGIAYNQFVLDDLPHNEHDQKLDMIVTETQVIRCERNK
jgi:5-formyltetrahydrofolate cyclo-ligase